jgi:aminoglycoside phosphotransferase (APT) family kinase protein
VPVPLELQDAELDAWWEGLGSRTHHTGLIHGDYYGGNLLADDTQVVGVLDWHEMEIGPLALEVAGASYEFCRNDDHELDDHAAQRFVAFYRESGGPLAEWEWAMIPDFRAWWVRRDALRSLSYGPDGDLNYARGQMRAFHVLRGRG